MAGNGWNLLETAISCCKLLFIAGITENGGKKLEFAGIAGNGWKLLEMAGLAQNGWEWLKLSRNVIRWRKWL